MGTNAQYLFALDNELKSHGMKDDCIGDLVGYVRQWLQQNTSGPIGGEARLTLSYLRGVVLRAPNV
ncbi:Uncharacterised protein [Serratia fonticola]|uniref:Uncharacterized protein n=1 Tax=Serratia fonticola TaxID=47917 RepID=A0A4U9TXZ5_SERFO|nr:Uncharacterised protein [Serratia fonticola]